MVSQPTTNSAASIYMFSLNDLEEISSLRKEKKKCWLGVVGFFWANNKKMDSTNKVNQNMINTGKFDI